MLRVILTKSKLKRIRFVASPAVCSVNIFVRERAVTLRLASCDWVYSKLLPNVRGRSRTQMLSERTASVLEHFFQRQKNTT